MDHLDISYNAKRMLVVTGCPSYDIKILDLENYETLNVEKIPTPKKLKMIKYNPSTVDMFAVMTDDELIIYELDKSYEIGDEMVGDVQNLIKIRSRNYGQGGEEDNQFTFLAWQVDNMIFLGNVTGNLIVLNALSFEVMSQLHVFSTIQFIMPTPKHLIVINKSNKIEFYEMDDTCKFSKSEPDKEYYFKNGTINQIFYNEPLQDMIVGVQNGEIYS